MGISIGDLNSRQAHSSGLESFAGEVRELSQEELRITGGYGHPGKGKGFGGNDDDIFFSRGPGNSRELFFASEDSSHGYGGDDGIFFSRGPGNSRELFFAPGNSGKGYGGDDDIFFSRGPGNSRELFFNS